MKKSPVLISFCLSLFASHANELDLKNYLKLVEESHPSLKILESKAEVAGLNKWNSRAAFLPTLGVESQYGVENKGPQSNDNSKVSSFSLTAKEVLWDNGESWIENKIAVITEKIELLKAKRGRAHFLSEAALAYFDYSKSIFQLEHEMETFDLVKKQASLSEAYFKQGLRPEKDYLRFAAAKLSAEISIEESKNLIEKTRLKLLEFLATETLKEKAEQKFLSYIPKEIPKPKILEPKGLVKELYLLETARADMESEKARRKYWPELSLSSTAKYGSDGYWGATGSYKDRDAWSFDVLLGFKMTLWNWGSDYRNREKTRLEAEQKKYELKKVLLSQDTQEGSRIMDYILRNSLLKKAETLVQIEERSFRRIDNEYRNAKVSFLDYLNALQSLRTARKKLVELKFDLARVVLELNADEGIFDENVL